MSTIKQFTDEQLVLWDTRRLGRLYAHSYAVSREEPEEQAQLERVSNILVTRIFPERLSVYRALRQYFHIHLRREEYLTAKLFKDMSEDYYRQVLD